MTRHSRAEDQRELRMQREQFGRETVYRVYERERLRQMARKLGLRLVKFSGTGKRAEKACGERPRSRKCPVLMMDARKKAASE